MSTACPYCRGVFLGDDATETCQACATPHHQDCFSENGGCSVFGCVNAPGDEPTIKVRIEDLADHFSSRDPRKPASPRTVAPAQAWQPGFDTAEQGGPVSGKARFGILLERACPVPPFLPWGLLLLFSVLTGGLFLLIWNLALARWLREVQPHSRALYYYSAVAVLHLVALACLIGGQMNDSDGAGIRLFVAAVIVLSLLGRFSMRRSLEEYFDQAGPIGLSLSEGMTLFFGSVYFQYHLNHVIKRKERREQAIA